MGTADLATVAKEGLERAYGTLIQRVTGAQTSLPATLLTRAIIEAGTSTQRHAHFEKEYLLVLSGAGEISSGNLNKNTVKVSKGALIEVPPFESHVISNTLNSDLEVLSIVSTEKDRSTLPESMLLTSAPPTPNGPLHLGHASGPYLGADLLGRYLKTRNVNVKRVFWTDDHQNYVAAKAEILGQPVAEVADRYRAEILAGLAQVGVEFDEVLNVRKNPQYRARPQMIFDDLLAKGLIELRETELPYCSHCQEILVDAYLDSLCPYCGDASSGSCETCGHYHAPDDAVNAHCKKCHAKAQTRKLVVARYDLEKSRSFLTEYLERTHMGTNLRARLHAILSKRLPKLLLTHPSKYGLVVEHERLTGQVFHVWFEMAGGMDFVRESSPSVAWTHFFGYDNAFFYALAIPALLEAYRSDYKHPTHLQSNEFLELEGKKFSTSRGHALWLSDEVRRLGRDFVRLALHYQSPQNARSSVSLEHLTVEKLRIEKQLDSLLALAATVARAGEPNFGTLTVEDKDFLANVHRRIREAEEALHPVFYNRRHVVRAALRLILEIEDYGISFGQSAQAASLQKMALTALGQLLSLLAPDFAQKLTKHLTLSPAWRRDF